MPDYGVRVKRKSSGKGRHGQKTSGFTPQTIGRSIVAILSWIGKPFYLVLTGLIIFSISLSWAVGRLAVLAFKGALPWSRATVLSLGLVILLFRRFFQRVRRTVLANILVAKRIGFLKVPFYLPKTYPRLPKIPPPAKIGILIFLLLITFWFLLLKDLPKPGELVTRERAVSTKIYDRNGNLLFKIFRNQNRTLVPLAEIPLHTRQATIAIEDSDFYSHPGFSLRGMTRAVWRNVTRGELTGGSTITQQLVKNALLSPEKTLARKIREVILAIQVELAFTKDQILEMYLNEVGYGGAAYGIEEAAQLYFGKHARDLSLAEGALLAGLPRAPTTYSPFGANPHLAKARQLEVLSRMVQEGYVTAQEAQNAGSGELVFAPQRTDIRAPHFVMYVKQLLVEKYGERMVEEGGLEVVTSLDLDIQDMAQRVVSGEVGKLGRLRVSNGAALVSNPKTGEILAMVGSKDYFDQEIDGNFNVTTAERQPGSAIKPVNYSYVLENKLFTAASIISDTPITYRIPGLEPYTPRNYDNHFRGRVTLRTALGSSLNVPAVKVLASYGVRNMIKQGKKLGITTWTQPSRFGLSLTLGGGEIKMTDMNTVYGTLANYGKRVNLQPILKVSDWRGKILEQNECAGKSLVNRFSISSVFRFAARAAEAAIEQNCEEQVLNPGVSFILTDILRDNAARTPAFGPNSLLVIPGHPEVAVKTGTTQNLRDNWAIGYTKDYVVAAWVGNNDNTPMSYVASGITGATPIWHRITRTLLDQSPVTSHQSSNPYWEVPPGVKRVTVCPLTGTLPCEGCPARGEFFIEGTEPTRHCSLKEEIEKKKEEGRRGGQVLSDEDAVRLLFAQ